MATAVELPTVDTLREEQRAIRAVLVRLKRRLGFELLLELAADTLIVLASAAAVLVFLDWWFRFGLAVRLILLVFAEVGVLAFLGMRALKRFQAVAARRADAGDDTRSPPAGDGAADCRRASASGATRVNRSICLASDGATGRWACVRRARPLGLAFAVEPQADGIRRSRIDCGSGCAGGVRRDRTQGGPIERGPLALPFVAALAAADVSQRDGIEQVGEPAGAA